MNRMATKVKVVEDAVEQLHRLGVSAERLRPLDEWLADERQKLQAEWQNTEDMVKALNEYRQLHGAFPWEIR